MHALMSVILALSKLADTPEGHAVGIAMVGGAYDLARRYAKTRVPASLLWDIHRVCKWLSEVTEPAAEKMDAKLGQKTKETPE